MPLPEPRENVDFSHHLHLLLLFKLLLLACYNETLECYQSFSLTTAFAFGAVGKQMMMIIIWEV